MPTVDPRDAELAACPWHDDNHENPPRVVSHNVRSLETTFHVVACDGCGTEGPRRATRREAIAAWNRRTRPEPLAGSGVAGELVAAIAAYHDAMPQAQGETGDPFAAKEASKAMARLLYTHSDAILQSLRAHPAPEQSAHCSGEVVEGLRIAAGIVESDLCAAEETKDADWEGQSREALDAVNSAIAALSAPRPDEGVIEALRRATIRSYSHKQLDLSLEFQNSDDLTAVVTSVGATPEKRP
jgi:hypothetical protein